MLGVAVVLAGVLAAVRPPAPLPEPPRLFFRTADAVAFELPTEADELRVAATVPGVGEPPVDGLEFEATLRFDTSAGDPVGSWPVTVRSRASVVWGESTPWRATTRILGDDGWLSEPRIVRVPVPEGAATVTVIAPDDTLVRLFARSDEALTLSRAAGVLSRSDRQRLQRATDAPDASWLTRIEREQVLSRSWTRLAPRDPGAAETQPVSTEAGVGDLSALLPGTVLPPGGSAAWTVRGDAILNLAGSSGVEDLQLGLVGEGQPSLELRPAPASAWPVLEETRIAVVRGPGLSTLSVHNRSEWDVRLWMRVGPEVQVFGTPREAALTPLDPLDHTRLVAPELRVLQAWTADSRRFPVAPGGVRLQAWRQLSTWEGESERVVEVRALDPAGRTLWRAPWRVGGTLGAVDFGGSPGARIPLSEATSTVVAPGSGASWIEVNGPDVWVRAQVGGPVRGQQPPLADAERRLRYVDTPSTWRSWPPTDPEREARRVHGTVRVEAVAPARVGSTYRSLDFVGGTRRWAVPDAPGSTAPTVCRIEGGGETTLSDAAADDRLTAWLVAPDGLLGQSWELTVDGARWRSGRFLQSVQRIRAAQVQWPVRLGLQADPSAALWVQGSGEQQCAERFRVARYRAVQPDESIRVELPPGPAGRLLSVAALGSGPALVELQLEGGSVVSVDATRRTAVLEMEGSGRVAQALDGAGQAPVLGSRGVRLGGDLSSGGTLVLTSRDDRPVYLRAAVQGIEASEAGPAASVLRPEEVVP